MFDSPLTFSQEQTFLDKQQQFTIGKVCQNNRINKQYRNIINSNIIYIIIKLIELIKPKLNH